MIRWIAATLVFMAGIGFGHATGAEFSQLDLPMVAYICLFIAGVALLLWEQVNA
jgi:hypothetical protein